MPPRAPAIGSATCAGCDSSPSTTSRLISSPTSRKKTAIKPSLIQSSNGLPRSMNVQEMPSLVSSAASIAPANGELASASASRLAAKSGTADAASLSMKAFSRFTPTAKRPGLATRASRWKSGFRLFAFLANEGHEELKQVHEVEVEAESAEDRDLLRHFGA